jgi:hypothetical protein
MSQALFNHMSREHGLTLLESEMDEITRLIAADLEAKLRDALNERDEALRKLKAVARAIDIAEKITDGQTDEQVALLASFNESMALTVLDQTEASLAAANETIKVLREAVEANHKWHQDYDEYNGYPDSELCNKNVSALAAGRL